MQAPNSIPGLRTVHGYGHNVLSPLEDVSASKSISQQSTPSSEESNSPTELNTYKRLTDKPPLIKRLTMGLTGKIILYIKNYNILNFILNFNFLEFH